MIQDSEKMETIEKAINDLRRNEHFFPNLISTIKDNGIFQTSGYNLISV